MELCSLVSMVKIDNMKRDNGCKHKVLRAVMRFMLVFSLLLLFATLFPPLFERFIDALDDVGRMKDSA